jgi:hypothetical protein
LLSFAIVAADEAFDPIVHAREDLTVFSMRLSQNCEGGYAVADLEVLNERTPLPGKRVLIAEDGVLIFDGFVTTSRGRVGSKIDLEVLAKPADADERLSALVESLKVAPYYDALTISPDRRGEAREVLEGYSRHIAWDRISHDVTAPDIYGGSAVIDLEPIEGTLSSSTTLPPSEIKLKAVASWRQLCRDTYDLGDKISGQKTMTPGGFVGVDEWLKPGDILGTGFVITKALIGIAEDIFGDAKVEKVVAQRSTGGYHIDPAFIADGVLEARAEISTLEAEFEVVHTYELRRSETMTATIPLSLQDGLVLQAPEEITINLQELTEQNSAAPWQPFAEYAVGDRVLHDGDIWRAVAEHIAGDEFVKAKWARLAEGEYIASRRHSSFMRSTRGKALCAHMLERGRARARSASRCIRLTFDTEMPADISALSADTVASISSPAIIGGAASGKVVEYVLRWANGRRDARFSVACSPGLSEANTLSLGESTWSTPIRSGGVEVKIVNPGELQEKYFKEFGDLPMSLSEPIIYDGAKIEKSMETLIEVSPVPATQEDLVGSISYQVEGLPGVPNGMRLE